MAEVYKNSNSLVTTTIFYGGQATDSEFPVVVSLYDITEDPTIVPALNPEDLITNITTTKSENNIGSYYFYMPKNLTDRNRKFKLIWGFVTGGTIGEQTTYVDVVTPYVDIAEAINELGFGIDLSDPMNKSYQDLMLAEKWARKRIEDYTGQEFYLYNDTQVVYGDGSDILTLPYKIHSVNSLYANDVLLVDEINSVNNWLYEPIISESKFGIRVNRASLLDNTVYTANGMVPPSINDRFGGAFPKNVRYVVNGMFGWDFVPDNVQQATIQLMGHYFDKDRFWKDQYVKKIQSFDWHVEYGSEITSGTGCEYADKLLNGYVLNQMVVI